MVLRNIRVAAVPEQHHRWSETGHEQDKRWPEAFIQLRAAGRF